MARKKVAAQPRTRAKGPIAILKAVAQEMLKEPLRYDQTDWGLVYVGEEEDKRPPCGTTACVAGWVTILTRPPEVETVRHLCNAEEVARTRLGLDSEQARALFSGSAVGGIPGTAYHAKEGVKHIERFMRQELGYTGPRLPLMVGKKK